MSNEQTLTSEFFSPDSLAKYLDLPVRTIYQWRQRGVGPRGIAVGRHVRYRRTDVEQWLEQQSDKRKDR